MSSFPAADSPSDSQKLVPFNVAKDRVKNELAGAVRDLGSGGEESENLSSLVRKIRALFPELMQLRGDQDATVELRDRQIHELSPYLLGTNTLIGGSAPENEGSGAEPLENPLDEVARRMWEISVTEQTIERYKAQEQAFRDEILASVSAEHLPMVRWALSQA
ncbi:MAG: hypothetical protein CMP26_01425 [Roseibacillus sp.]|nr:hypothetical protein [Roseibacillus sp.]MBQ65022.1 hypothetical protein [Euryarchaeota archaeon]HAO96976.1 hypothetical protein [Verrucomicrobiales bacterium]|tara:strand:- start:10729 stop:11217 length:489 start_codon:yes stop_codon:yes gene_type:complete